MIKTIQLTNGAIDVPVITYGDYRSASKKNPEKPSREITVKLLNKSPADILTPDYNAVNEVVSEQIGSDRWHYAEHEAHDSETMLMPLCHASDGLPDAIKFNYPSLSVSDAFDGYSDADQATEFLVINCTDLEPEQLELLSMTDWNTLVFKVNRFLNEPAHSLIETASST